MQDFHRFDDVIYSRFSAPAAIIEYKNGQVSIVAINDKYLAEIALNIDKQQYLATNLQNRLDEGNLQVYLNCVKKCIETGKEQNCETKRSMIENCCGIDYIWIKSYM
ncbi:MAG: hypothetical protein K6F16_04590, partial [Lachnospiraceae bacterium]|nr:hypothetical protein [Lachnospiraceae bacterium]